MLGPVSIVCMHCLRVIAAIHSSVACWGFFCGRIFCLIISSCGRFPFFLVASALFALLLLLFLQLLELERKLKYSHYRLRPMFDLPAFLMPQASPLCLSPCPP